MSATPRIFLSVVLCMIAGCDSKPATDADAGKAAPPPAKADAASPEAKAETKAEAKVEKPEDYGTEMCATIIPCFEKLEFNGNFTADVTIDLEPDGKVSSVSFTGEAPQPVQSCITDTIQSMVVSPYNGKPGRTRCKQSGQLGGGARMVMSDSSYEVREG